MDKSRQFSLAYLFFETFWIAASLGLSRVLISTVATPTLYWFLFLMLFVVATGAAIGGLFKNMLKGTAIATFIFFCVIVLLWILGFLIVLAA